MEPTQLILSSLLNGLIVGILGFTVSTLLMIIYEPDFSFKKYTFWFRVFLGSFITGFIMYIFTQYVKY